MWIVVVLLWILAVFVGLIALGFVLVGLAMVAGDELCPRCGCSLGVTNHDRFNRSYVRFRGPSRYNQCLQCGWRRHRR